MAGGRCETGSHVEGECPRLVPHTMLLDAHRKCAMCLRPVPTKCALRMRCRRCWWPGSSPALQDGGSRCEGHAECMPHSQGYFDWLIELSTAAR